MWEVIVTETFSSEFRKHKKDGEFVRALDKKIERMKEDPSSVGGFLSGNLHGYKSTRILSKFRILFRVNESEHRVYLIAIDHRKFGYERFDVD